MKYKEGFKRLWILLSIIWILFSTYEILSYKAKEHFRVVHAYISTCEDLTAQEYNECYKLQTEKADKQIENSSVSNAFLLAWLFSIFLPIFLWKIFIWIYLGFKKND